ncbi:SgcJ/EcaC family oxidoreductase [Rathayibacter sp. VKM Ac-2803]|uniref:SgcJ/EcaC family oxidoreductase n=1 Tax=unclassified Rathayibacter TaxID=2609250 RepID=UPI0013582AC2|nr:MULTISPECIES: SgcJ/EcaC family oxidoreductase [unclassified Rathayibacter]MWV48445.1 SgcJ/EcaC family oxidoreductase [Rathayibacter sp. VKM Ac-2803]MWV60801.1 SgcJ/EcaC family oxidoreductase [Rathayibacter sp. VKM Ac-2754]
MTPRTRTSLSLLALPAAAVLALTGCSAGAAQAASDDTVTAAPTEAEVTALFDEWNASLATGDPEQVDEHYAEDAVLLPTVAPGIHDTPEERLGYFESFLENEPSGVITESVVRDLGEGYASHSGLYTFTMGASGDVVPARFTFVYADIDGEWRIVEHHSSKEPVAE